MSYKKVLSARLIEVFVWPQNDPGTTLHNYYDSIIMAKRLVTPCSTTTIYCNELNRTQSDELFKSPTGKFSFH